MVSLIALSLCVLDVGVTPALRVDWDSPRQTMIGFGGSYPEYTLDLLAAHPQRAEIVRKTLDESGVRLLRLENAVGRGDWEAQKLPRIASILRLSDRWKRREIDLLLTTGSPPTELKSGGKLEGGSLRRVEGGFDYAGFADWWSRSLDAWKRAGLEPRYVSPANEPDFVGTWPTTRLLAREGSIDGEEAAGYDRALAAVQKSLRGRAQIVGPEVIGIGYGTVSRYLDALSTPSLDGIAFHLYHGGTFDDPKSFVPDLRATAALGERLKRPLFMTEYARHDPDPDPLREARNLSVLIRLVLLEGQVAAYFHWDLVERGQKGLLSLTEDGFRENPIYGVFRTWARAGQPGRRVATVEVPAPLEGLAFVHRDGRAADVVVVNPSNRAAAVKVGGSLRTIEPGSTVSFVVRRER